MVTLVTAVTFIYLECVLFMMSNVIRISDEQKQWLDEKKLEYFNTTSVSYRAVLDKITEEIDG